MTKPTATDQSWVEQIIPTPSSLGLHIREEHPMGSVRKQQQTKTYAATRVHALLLCPMTRTKHTYVCPLS